MYSLGDEKARGWPRLLHREKNNVKSGSGAIDHVAFNCEDIDSMKEMFDNKSIEYTHRKVPGFPLEQLFVDDPDGVKVELNFPTKG